MVKVQFQKWDGEWWDFETVDIETFLYDHGADLTEDEVSCVRELVAVEKFGGGGSWDWRIVKMD